MRRLAPGLVLLLAGCAAAPRADTVFFASGADLQTINPLITTHPLAKQVERYVLFMTLVRYDSALVPQPYLAESWSWNSSRTELTFRIRDDVKWHDGTPTTAADAAQTLRAARDSATGYPRGSELSCVTDIRASGRDLVLDFCRPQSTLPDVLTDLAILPASAFPRPTSNIPRPEFLARPIGNGPFRFVQHIPNQRWIFEANPDFPRTLGGPPRLPRLAIVVVDEATTKLAGLVDGELDVAGINAMHASVVRRVDHRRVLEYPLLLSYGLVWNTSRPPFNDARVRRALTMALDRRQMLDAYIFGFGSLGEGPVPPAHPLAVSVPAIPFDRAGARALLDSLGFGSRHPSLSFTLSTVGTSDNVLEQLIQADLAAVGVQVRIRQLELGAFLAMAQGPARDYDALVTGITGDLALGYLDALFDSRRLGGPLQYARYRNPDVDRALDRGDLAEVQRIVARDVPITFLYHARGIQGVNDRVKGLRMDLRGELPTVAEWSVH